MRALSASYTFHPVGQGLFSSGMLFALSHPYKCSHSQPFRWVYDCGTTSSQNLIVNEVDRLARYATASHGIKPVLDIVVISHFDKDHISGLVRLLGRFRVRTLLLPYMPLWQRLSLVFGNATYTSREEMRFYLNPITFINEIENVEIESILLVPPSEGISPTIPPNNVRRPSENDNDLWSLEYESNELDGNDPEQQHWISDRSQVKYPISTAMLCSGSALRVAQRWEFIPYNDTCASSKPPATFLNAVSVERATLIAAPLESTRKDALKRLKSTYDKHFGKTAKMRNCISLYLYGGPIGKVWSVSDTNPFERSNTFSYCGICDVADCTYCDTASCKYCDSICSWPAFHSHLHLMPSGILYTGDAYLDDADSLDRLMSYLGIPSGRTLFCLQVMHHGSIKNWHPGVAHRLAPVISVFSSDPMHKRFRHPHEPVWEDFKYFGRRQVDRTSGLSIRTCFYTYW